MKFSSRREIQRGQARKEKWKNDFHSHRKRLAFEAALHKNQMGQKSKEFRIRWIDK